MRRIVLLFALASLLSVAYAQPVRQLPGRVEVEEGISLISTVFLPEGEGPFPVIIDRSSYPRGGGLRWSNNGFAAVVQSVRGRFGSGGEYAPFQGYGWLEPLDGLATLRWTHGQRWCNGRLGTYGDQVSAIGSAFLAAAGAKLDCQVFIHGAGALRDIAYEGGVLREAFVDHFTRNVVMHEPLADEWREHDPGDEAYWQQYDALDRAEKVRAPGLFFGGWWSTMAPATIDLYQARQKSAAKSARGRQRLVMAPTGIAEYSELGMGLADYRNFDSWAYLLRFYNFHLKQQENGLPKTPNVIFYMLGDDTDLAGPGWEWRVASDWPPYEDAEQTFYLTHEGVLQDGRPEGGQRTFAFDPGNPVPTRGGQMPTSPFGPYDQNELGERDDVLRFTSEPFEEPMEASGSFSVTLHVSTDAPDTDFTAKLVDVYPPDEDGSVREILMLDSIQRLRWRDGGESPAPDMQPGEVVPIRIDLGDISWAFAKGHRVGLHVSSSNAPRFAVNPNNGDRFMGDGGKPRVANNTIHFGDSVLRAPLRPYKPQTSASEE